MATYVIGDLQGCFDELQVLLRKIKFDRETDKLWFAGDLVNRGPKSLDCVRFVKDLGNAAVTVLGNHDLSCLYKWHCKKSPPVTLRKLFRAKDAAELMVWLQKQPIAHYDSNYDVLMVHAGVPPQWSLSQTMVCAAELSRVLNSKKTKKFYQQMYGNKPDTWKSGLKGHKRLRYITNALTRMRYCTTNGALKLESRASPNRIPKGLMRWFDYPHLIPLPKVVFGHWAALMGKTGNKQFIGVDTGCVWGNHLTAYRLDDGKYFKVKAGSV